MPTSVHIPTKAELATRKPGQTIAEHLGALKDARDAHYEQVQVIRRRAEVGRRDLTKSEERAYRSHLDQVEDLSELHDEVYNSPEAQKVDRSQVIIATGVDAPWDYGPGSEHRSAAMRVVSEHHRSGQLPDHAAELVEQLVSTGPPASRSFSARWVAETGSQAYWDAFAKYCVDPERGHLTWTEEERACWQRVQHMRAEQRAMGITDSVGGYGALPYRLDPTIILTNSGTINPLRTIARIVTTTTDTWRGVTSAGSTASWDDEAEEVSDDSPTLASPSIAVHRCQTFVPFSREIEQDWAGPSLAQELATVLIEAADRLMSTGYTVGSGTGEPKGLITAVAAVSGSVVAPATAETLASADVYSVIEALPARWRPNAQWMANLNVINDIDQMETGNGAKLFPRVGDDQPVLLRRRLHENSEMDGAWNPAATASNYVLLCGDMRQFVVVDKAFSASVELVPHLFGANQRPTGQRGAYLFLRTGSDVTTADAFRLLNIATTA